MKLSPVGPNQTILTFPNEDEVFFSYETPVAGWINGEGYWRAERKYSRTTTKHVSRYANTYRVRTLTDDQVAETLKGYGL